MTDIAEPVPAADFEAVRDRYRIERDRRAQAGDRRYPIRARATPASSPTTR